MKNTGRDQVQNTLLTIDDESVTGVVAALETDDRLGILCQHIDNLAFAFVSPLRAENHDIGHCIAP